VFTHLIQKQEKAAHNGMNPNLAAVDASIDGF